MGPGDERPFLTARRGAHGGDRQIFAADRPLPALYERGLAPMRPAPGTLVTGSHGCRAWTVAGRRCSPPPEQIRPSDAPLQADLRDEGAQSCPSMLRCHNLHTRPPWCAGSWWFAQTRIGAETVCPMSMAPCSPCVHRACRWWQALLCFLLCCKTDVCFIVHAFSGVALVSLRTILVPDVSDM
jgi:hypothetical protein